MYGVTKALKDNENCNDVAFLSDAFSGYISHKGKARWGGLQLW